MRTSRDRFTQLAFDAAEDVLGRLPDDLRAEAEDVVLEIQPRPSREQLERLDMEAGSTLLGLYAGVPLVERHADSILLQPDRVTLFQQPLQAISRTEAELKERLRRVIIHELAHFFGRTDDELRAMGKY